MIDLKGHMIFILANWLVAWADMLCGLVSIVTLTFYRPWWDFKFRVFVDKTLLKAEIERRKKQERRK